MSQAVKTEATPAFPKNLSGFGIGVVFDIGSSDEEEAHLKSGSAAGPAAGPATGAAPGPSGGRGRPPNTWQAAVGEAAVGEAAVGEQSM